MQAAVKIIGKWCQRLEQEVRSIIKQLSKLQRLALLCITRAMKTTPAAALEALLNIEPLHLYVESIARSSCARLYQSNLLTKSNHGHAKLWNLMAKETPHIEMPCDAITPKYRFYNEFKVSLPTREDWTDNETMTNDASWTWFSDRIKASGNSGS